MEFVSTIQYTLLVNGSTTMSFKLAKGLRQGDPLSPYLFLLCANVLSLSLQKAEQEKLINGVRVGRNGCSFTHLLYADDSLFFFKNDNKSLVNLRGILDWYCNLSGQYINYEKSDLFCSPNMSNEEQVCLARLLNVNLVQNPSKYLGQNFKLKGNKVADFQFLVDKLQSKLQGWKASLFSQAERTRLIASILQTLPLYTFSCFKVPETICKKMDSIVNAFWWGHDLEVRKLHLMNWNKICQPKSWGGLGLKKFNLLNQAMLAKQYWRISQHPNSLIARTFKAK